MKKYKTYVDELITEKKYFIYSRIFRIKDLFDKIYYTKNEINDWMKLYDFDLMAFGIFVSLTHHNSENILDMRISSRDIKNKTFFDDNSLNKDGHFILDSKITINNEDVYLYVFRKGSNDTNRARQIHGFKYEAEIIRLNKLEKMSKYTDKWDAKGSIDENFFKKRIKENKKITFYDGHKEKEITWDQLDDKYKKYYNWNIKCIGEKNSIDMADYRRISGLSKDFKYKNSIYDEFILNVCFHENKIPKTEYIIFIDINTWKSYLPDLQISDIIDMFTTLKKHKLVSDRTKESEEAWYNYRKKYFFDSIIKLRFKRNHSQLRIQSSISNKNFKEKILKENKFIKIA